MSPVESPRGPHWRLRTRAIKRIVTLQTIAMLGFAISGCSGVVPTPGTDISSAQAILDLGAAFGQLREENAMLQAQIDSLQAVVVYQDSIVRQLAALSNVSMRPPAPSVP